jgi:hypothetical protein
MHINQGRWKNVNVSGGGISPIIKRSIELSISDVTIQTYDDIVLKMKKKID